VYLGVNSTNHTFTGTGEVDSGTVRQNQYLRISLMLDIIENLTNLEKSSDVIS